MNKNLLILGAGQYGTVIKELAQEIGSFEKVDFLDDTFGLPLTEGNYHEASIGKLEDYESFRCDYSYAIASVEDPTMRSEWTKKLEESGYCVPILVSPHAYVSPSAQLNRGCVVEPLAGINANSIVGIGTFIAMGAVVDHNSFVGDYCNIGCNAVIMSGALLSVGEKVNAGEVIRHVPMVFSLEKDGSIHAAKMPITPSEYSFDDVM